MSFLRFPVPWADPLDPALLWGLNRPLDSRSFRSHGLSDGCTGQTVILSACHRVIDGTAWFMDPRDEPGPEQMLCMWLPRFSPQHRVPPRSSFEHPKLGPEGSLHGTMKVVASPCAPIYSRQSRCSLGCREQMGGASMATAGPSAAS